MAMSNWIVKWFWWLKQSVHQKMVGICHHRLHGWQYLSCFVKSCNSPSFSKHSSSTSEGELPMGARGSFFPSGAGPAPGAALLWFWPNLCASLLKIIIQKARNFGAKVEKPTASLWFADRKPQHENTGSFHSGFCAPEVDDFPTKER